MGANVVSDLESAAIILGGKSSVFDKETELNKKIMKSYFKIEAV